MVVQLQMYGGLATIGEYYVHVDIGEPAQRVRMQVDTGSSSMIVPASDCATCEHHAPQAYDMYASRTAVPIRCDSEQCGAGTCSALQCDSTACSIERDACCASDNPSECGFYLKYGGDTAYSVSARGMLVRDRVRLGHSNAEANVTLYRTTQESGPWPSSVDGILGLAHSRLNCNPTCTDPAYQFFEGADRVFSMCMSERGGVLLFGSDGTREGLAQGQIQYVPEIRGVYSTYYMVELRSLQLGGVEVSNSRDSPHTLIVDSGTTLLLLQRDLWLGMVNMFQRDYCALKGVCTKTNIFSQGVCLTSPPEGFPHLTFELDQGVMLTLPPSMYFLRYADRGVEGYVYCLGIQEAGNERTVLGDTFMRSFLTVFDREHGRIGFALPNSSRCGASGAISAVDPGLGAFERSATGAAALFFDAILAGCAALALFGISVFVVKRFWVAVRGHDAAAPRFSTPRTLLVDPPRQVGGQPGRSSDYGTYASMVER